MQRLAGQVAVVTGGALGIGQATAQRLVEEGAKVLVADVNMDAARATVESIREEGGTAESFKADVGIHEDIRSMVQKAVELWGRLDILVNNAYARIGDGSALDVAEEDWDRGMAMLVKSMFLGAKYAVPEMRKVGAGNIDSLVKTRFEEVPAIQHI